ncbi:MAG: D-glycero-beta-D-manno-heptose 1-phosphate adenylyltransferase [Phycisphaeraceae bacterium]|nr:D-glycero-beta-D-manno-heptose 1-phosphate adenylyltransferase [Phycisphaeraceae bacterium]
MSDPQQPDNLVSILDRWQRTRMIVVGDFMLDRHIYGNAERLSPDAPVPVLAAERREHAAGGAANVCLDLRALRCDVHCVGVVGRDVHGRTLRHELSKAGCKVAGLIAASDRPTTVKHNFVGLAQHRHPQKMFRVDDEKRAAIPPDVEKKLLAKIDPLLKRADVLCIEDYNKGVLTPGMCQAVIRMAKKARVPVFVDPAAISDFSKYRGCTCITPNRSEASLATGLNAAAANGRTLERIGRRLQQDLSIANVVLTLDRQGLMLVRAKQPPLHVPTQVREVYDVTGAGDMVLAALASGCANGLDWPEALALANLAAGLEVERFGVAPIALHELLLAELERHRAESGKLRTLDQLAVELDAYRAQGKNIVFTNGCFDILHAGHVQYLRQARRLGDLLVVAINSDRSIRKLKGKGRPVNTQLDRVMVLSELASVDYIVIFDGLTPEPLLRRLKPHVLVKGADYKRKQDVVGWQIVEGYGGRIERVGLIEGLSTTNIIRKVRGQ